MTESETEQNEVENIVRKMKELSDVLFDSPDTQEDAWSEELHAVVGELTRCLDEFNALPDAQRLQYSSDHLQACRGLIRVGYHDVASHLVLVTKEDRRPGMNSIAIMRADALGSIVTDLRGIFLFDEEEILPDLIEELILNGTVQAVNMGLHIRSEQPRKTRKLFKAVLKRMRAGIYYGQSNKYEALCKMAYVTRESLIPFDTQMGETLYRDIIKTASETLADSDYLSMFRERYA